MAKSNLAREVGKPVTLEEVQTALTAYSEAVAAYCSQFPQEKLPGSFLTDASFKKVNGLLKFLITNPTLFPKVSREELATGIQDYLSFSELLKSSGEPVQRIKAGTERQSKQLHKTVLNVYNSAKSDLKTELGGDPVLLQGLVGDLKEMFEKGPATRRKNRKEKSKLGVPAET